MIPTSETIPAWSVQRRGEETRPDSPGGSGLLTLGEEEGKPAEWPLVFFLFSSRIYLSEALSSRGQSQDEMKTRTQTS